MKLYVKNMVTPRCQTIVKRELKRLKLDYIHVDPEEIEFAKKLSLKKYHALEIALFKSGLELMNQKKSMFIENLIDEIVNYADKLPRANFSDYLGKKLNCDYGHLSHLFSQVKGTTIEQFIIAHKIERVALANEVKMIVNAQFVKQKVAEVQEMK